MPELLLQLVIRPTLHWLAGPMARIPHTLDAERLLLAIAIQETELRHRRQVPVAHAMGWWQFEREGGVKGVLQHTATRAFATIILDTLRLPQDRVFVHHALEHNDALACAFARLLLRTDPHPLPVTAPAAWTCYLRIWRPGKPHPERWPAAFERAHQAAIGNAA